MSKVKENINSENQVLNSLGLSENEILLYTKMLAKPRSTVQQLVTLALFPRTMLYHVLNQLVSKGLVTTQETKSKTIYIAKDPENIYDLMHKKEKEFGQNILNIKELVPKLKYQYLLFGKVPNVRTFSGIEEYEKALEDILISKPNIIYSYEDLNSRKPAWEVRENFDRRRVLRKVVKNVLFFENSHSLKYLSEINYNDFTNFRGLTEKDISAFSTNIILYDNKILYTTFPDSHEPVAILIEDKNLFEMQKAVFENFWKIGKNRTLYYTEVNKTNI